MSFNKIHDAAFERITGIITGIGKIAGIGKRGNKEVGIMEKNHDTDWNQASKEDISSANGAIKQETAEFTNEERAQSRQSEEINWVKLGVPGFDALITNGIPQGSAVLVSGGPGSGKTTFCLQVINEAAKAGTNCLYLTFEESPERLKQHMKNYGWNPDLLERNENLVIKKMHPYEISRSIEALLAKASGELEIELEQVEGIIPKGFAPKIILLDSLSAVASAFAGKEDGYRIYIDQLFGMFKEIGATSFLITEVEQDAKNYSKSGIEEFLADAVIVFYNIRNRDVRTSAIEVLKVRGTSHQKKIVPFKIISGKGIEIYPDEATII